MNNFRINIETLKTEGRVSVSDFVGIVSHTSHPHLIPNGTVNIKSIIFHETRNQICYNLGVQSGIVGGPVRYALH